MRLDTRGLKHRTRKKLEFQVDTNEYSTVFSARSEYTGVKKNFLLGFEVFFFFLLRCFTRNPSSPHVGTTRTSSVGFVRQTAG